MGSPEVNTADPMELSDRERIARHLRKHIIDQASGRDVSNPHGEDENRVYQDFPSTRFFAGALSPQSPDQLSGLDDDLQSKMEPSAIGSTIKITGENEDDFLEIVVSGAVWVRVYPTYEELQNRDEYISLTEQETDSEEDEDLLPVFTRIPFRTDPISIDLDELRNTAEDSHESAVDIVNITRAFQQVSALARDRDDIYRVDPEDDSQVSIPQSAVESAEDYEEFLESLEGDPAIPDWDATVEIQALPDEENPTDDSVLVDIELTNIAEKNQEQQWRTLRDPSLFEVQMEFEAGGDAEFVPYTFDPLPQDFRYNRDLWGHGRNCTIQAPDYDVRRDPERPPGVQAPEASPSTSNLRTQFLPEYRQRKYRSADRGLDTSFDTFTDLDDGGMEALETIADAMDEYLEEEYSAALSEYQERADWDEGDREDFLDDREKFQREIQRFRRGIECMERHPGQVGRAFELMNETMSRKHDFDSWHLFQLIFIVILLPDITSREHEEFREPDWREGVETEQDAETALDVVDVLWFPTGGGKTEAFLGVAVWNMFFDRLRGKHFGVTTWTRFPLRLLSLQQVQRITETVTTAEIVRREFGDTHGIDTRPSRPFSVGYLVGKANTPNALTGYDNSNEKRYREDDDLREEAKVISRCPSCGSDVKLRVTDDQRLTHYCTGSTFGCNWQQRSEETEETYDTDELPVHIVDNELYRYAPTILAGTIDKIAAIGYQRKMAHLLTGEIEAECPIHGFASLGECTEKYGCDIESDDFEAMSFDVTPYDPAPSLMVPDELHLLKESMGSFDGHYETGVEYLQDLVDAGKTKILAPTATITGYSDQVYHLYNRPAERFPSPGPFLRENFYATEKEDTERFYLGIIPHGRTHINSILQILYEFHHEVQTLLRIALAEPDAFLEGEYLEDTDGEHHPLDSEEIVPVLEELLQYSISLTYLLSKKDGDRLNQSFQSQLDQYFREDDRPPLERKSMTGGTPFDKIQTNLEQLEKPWASIDQEKVIDRISTNLLPTEHEGEVLHLYRQIGGRLAQEEQEEYLDREPEEIEAAIRDANEDVAEGLAWVLASWPNAITATSMVSHGVDVSRFNFMTFFGMPRRTAEYIQSSSRAGRDAPGLVLNIMHPIRERDLSHYHFFEKYHEFLDRLVEPVAINRWAKNSISRTHSGLFMGLLLNHYMYHDDEERNLYFGDNAEELIRDLEQNEPEALEQALVEMIGGDAAPDEFRTKAADMTTTAAQQLKVDDNKWTSNRLPESAMRSLRDIDDQLPIRSEYQYRDIFETLDNRWSQ